MTGRRLRLVLLALGSVLTVAGFLWILWPEAWKGVVDDPAGLLGTPAVVGDGDEDYRAFAFAFVGVLLLTQWLFLRPRRGWTVRLAESGRPLGLAAFGAAFAATLLTAGLVATLLEIPDWWTGLFEEGGMGPVLLGVLGLWLLWTLVFYAYWRAGDEYTRLTRILRALVGGSFLELLVATPVHIACHERDDCYCARGSYTGLVFGGTVLVWAFGPGIVLLYLRERNRRSKLLRPQPAPHE
jgi:hypothetical protein